MILLLLHTLCDWIMDSLVQNAVLPALLPKFLS